MSNTLDQLTVDGSIPDEIYRLMRDAIQTAGKRAVTSSKPVKSHTIRPSPHFLPSKPLDTPFRNPPQTRNS
jgi:hypothetical protein